MGEAADIFVTTALMVVIFTIFIQGGTIKLLVDLLNINKAEDEQKALLEELTDSVIGDLMPGIEVILGKKGHFWLESSFTSLDEKFLLPLLTRQDYSSEMARIYEDLLLEEHQGALYSRQHSTQAQPHTPEIGIVNPGFVEEKPKMVTLNTGGLLGIPGQARDRRMSTASMISAISRRSHVPKGDVKDDKAALKSALKDTSALGRTKMGMQRHLAGETEQELRLQAELLQLAASGRGSVEEERQSEGRKISQNWLDAAERVTRKTSVASVASLVISQRRRTISENFGFAGVTVEKRN